MGNVDLVLTIYDRVARGETVRELFHDDVEWSMPHPGGEAHGLAEVGAFWRDYEATWTERVLEVEEVRPLDDERVLVFFRETAVGRASDRDGRQPGRHLDAARRQGSALPGLDRARRRPARRRARGLKGQRRPVGRAAVGGWS